MPKVTMIPPTRPDESGRTRVAAYCRVSHGTAEQHNSFIVQTEYYRNKFQYSDTEILVEIYADEGETGTDSRRENFQRMIKDCHKGKIDRIYTKSVSRFARNTKDCLQYARELKAIGVSIVFEKERLDTALLTDEMMLTVMSGLAQEESVSISQNIRWNIRRKMQNGTFKTTKAPYGYVLENGRLKISEPEAGVVRQIFAWYLSGYGAHRIRQFLNDAGIPTGNELEEWRKIHVQHILKNEKYTGDSLFQKTYTTDAVPFRVKRNHGEVPMYYVSGTHDAIISKEDFEKVQELMKIRTKKPLSEPGCYPLTKKIVCSCCGRHFLRKPKAKNELWVCGIHAVKAADCPNMPIKSETVYTAFIRLFNKLFFHYKEILIPVQKTLSELKKAEFSGNVRVSDIQTEIAKLREQNHVLASLRTKGFLSSEKYQEQSAGLHTRIAKLQKELFRLTCQDDERELFEELALLIDYFESRQEKMTEFEPDVFGYLIEKIVLKENHELEFYLPGDIHFTEYI